MVLMGPPGVKAGPV